MEEGEALIGDCPVKDRSAFLVVQFNRQVIDPVQPFFVVSREKCEFRSLDIDFQNRNPVLLRFAQEATDCRRKDEWHLPRFRSANHAGPFLASTIGRFFPCQAGFFRPNGGPHHAVSSREPSQICFEHRTVGWVGFNSGKRCFRKACQKICGGIADVRAAIEDEFGLLDIVQTSVLSLDKDLPEHLHVAGIRPAQESEASVLAAQGVRCAYPEETHPQPLKLVQRESSETEAQN